MVVVSSGNKTVFFYISAYAQQAEQLRQMGLDVMEDGKRKHIQPKKEKAFQSKSSYKMWYPEILPKAENPLQNTHRYDPSHMTSQFTKKNYSN